MIIAGAERQIVLNDISELPALFRLRRLTCTFLCPLELDLGPGLVSRIRGAFGDRIRRWEEAGRGEAKELRATLFPEKYRDTLPTPAPFLLAADVEGSRLHITLTLIGHAAILFETAFDAMIHCLVHPPGLAFLQSSKKREVLNLIDCNTDFISGLPVRPLANFEILNFLTPLKIGPEDALGTSFSDVIFSIAQRAARLAVHESVLVRPAGSTWRELAKSQSYDASDLRAVTWKENSSATGVRTLRGYLGKLRLAQPASEIAPLLALGSYLHAGSNAGLGLGRFTY